MFHRDPAHTGYTPNAGPTTTPVEIWSCAISSDVAATSPTVSGDYVFVTDEVFTYCLNVSTGGELWRAVGGGGSTPAVYGGCVYTGSGVCTAFNASTGAKVWNLTAVSAGSGRIGAVVGGVVYAVGGNAYALNAATGAIIWNYTTGNPNTAGNVYSSPAVANGKVYIGVYNGNVYCLNAATGALMWNYTTGSNIHSSPAIAGDVVYIGSDDGNLYALNASTGTKMWNYTIQPILDERGSPRYLYASPAIANGIIYMGSADGDVYALGAASNTTLPQTTPEFLNQILIIALASIIVVASLVLIRKKWIKKKINKSNLANEASIKVYICDELEPVRTSTSHNPNARNFKINA